MPSRVEVLSSDRVYDGYFKIDCARLRFERYDGAMSSLITRLVFERGDSVAVIPFDGERHEVVLVQQFRYPAHVRGGPGWLWEIIAGTLDEGRDTESVVRSEAIEEAGYHLGELSHAMTVYSSPGGSSERIHIYVAPVTRESHVAGGGGLCDSGEDILVSAFSLDDAFEMVEDGRIVDAKTVLALQHLALHRDDV